MKSPWQRWLWRGVKLAAALAVLFFIARRFHTDLAGLDFSTLEVRPGWIAASGAFYLLGIFPSAWFWRHVHAGFGYPMSLYAAVRAHTIGQLGKYVPGKALAVLIRSHLVHPYGVPYGVSVIVSFYEVFTGMAAGAIVAAILFVVDPPPLAADFRMHPAVIGVGLLALCGIPLLPGVFNFVIARLTKRIQAIELYHLTPIRIGTLLTGLLATGAGWWLQGLSVWAIFQAVVPAPRDFTLDWWAVCTAAIAFANVAGFVIFFIPAGLGVREDLLRMLLGNAGTDTYTALAVIVLRLTWIVAEALFTLCTYWIKPAGERSEPAVSVTP